MHMVPANEFCLLYAEEPANVRTEVQKMKASPRCRRAQGPTQNRRGRSLRGAITESSSTLSSKQIHNNMNLVTSIGNLINSVMANWKTRGLRCVPMCRDVSRCGFAQSGQQGNSLQHPEAENQTIAPGQSPMLKISARAELKNSLWLGLRETPSAPPFQASAPHRTVVQVTSPVARLIELFFNVQYSTVGLPKLSPGPAPLPHKFQH